MHFWLEIKCQSECNNDYDKNKGHAYRFLCYLTFSFRTSNWNNHVWTILHIFEQDFCHFGVSIIDVRWRKIREPISDRHFQYFSHYRSTSIIKLDLDRISKWSFATNFCLAEMLKTSIWNAVDDEFIQIFRTRMKDMRHVQITHHNPGWISWTAGLL